MSKLISKKITQKILSRCQVFRSKDTDTNTYQTLPDCHDIPPLSESSVAKEAEMDVIMAQYHRKYMPISSALSIIIIRV